MNRRDVKAITVFVPSKDMTMPFTVTAESTFAELFCAAGCPDWYVLSRTRRGPAISLTKRRLLDIAYHNGKIYLSPPIKMHQLDLPLQEIKSVASGTTEARCTATSNEGEPS